MAYVIETLTDVDFIACEECHTRILMGQVFYRDEETGHIICPDCLGVEIDPDYHHGCEG